MKRVAWTTAVPSTSPMHGPETVRIGDYGAIECSGPRPEQNYRVSWGTVLVTLEMAKVAATVGWADEGPGDNDKIRDAGLTRINRGEWAALQELVKWRSKQSDARRANDN